MEGEPRGFTETENRPQRRGGSDEGGTACAESAPPVKTTALMIRRRRDRPSFMMPASLLLRADCRSRSIHMIITRSEE
ncbi:hypothetical protein A0U92_01550 [Acetobacter aceti]|uniref:Uncharacterized protein n=1 Tax=Acetobacter aceti TaxID=435 RepID=A0A1U9KD61_ACEAC|nr:hypothetical protein A0U92_01550 [Acetobacter aceti]